MIEKKLPNFVDKSIEDIKERNKTQGRNGCFIGYVNCPYDIIRKIYKLDNIEIYDEQIKSAYEASYQTLLEERQTIDAKMEAIDLMIFLKGRFNKESNPNDEKSSILDQKEIIETGSSDLSNSSKLNLKLSALLLYNSYKEDVSIELISVLADIEDDIYSLLKAEKSFLNYLQAWNSKSDIKIEQIILQNTIRWCYSSNRNVRCQAVNILYYMN